MSMNQRDPLFKAVDAAFAYYPYRFDEAKVLPHLLHEPAGAKAVDDWVIGPTFIVKVSGYRYQGQRLPYKLNRLWLLYATRILTDAPKAKQPFRVAENGHRRLTGGKCTGRVLYDGKGAPRFELAYPLYRLGKKLGVQAYRTIEVDTRALVQPIYGFDGSDALVAVFQPRLILKCDVEAS